MDVEVDRKFECSFPGCGKAFKRRDYLTRHEGNHSNVRPFQCLLCQKSFARRDLLDKHFRSKSHQLELLSKDNSRVTGTFNIDLNSANQLFPPTKRLKPLQHDDEKSSHASDADPFDSESIENLMNCGRFSNVANAIEDSFGWLFGSATPSEVSFDPREDISKTLHANQELQIMEFGVSDDTLIKLQRFIRNETKLSDHIMSRENVNVYLTSYWQFFGAVFPLIHRPTLDLNAFEKYNLGIYFLLSLITLGMACLGSSQVPPQHARLQSIEIQRALRGHIHHLLDTTEYNMSTISLKLVQSALLSDIFHLYYGDAQQHIKFTIHHPVIINILKQMELYVNLTEPYLDPQDVDFIKWSNWVRYESLKRIAFFAYILDTQSSFLIGTSSSISVFDVQLELPYTDSVWMAPDAVHFAAAYRMLPRDLVARRDYANPGTLEKRYQINKEDVMSNGNLIPNVKSESRWPNFLWSIRRLMQPYTGGQEEYHLNCFSQFSRFVLLHGVLSLVRELRTRNVFMTESKESAKTLNTIAARIEHAFFSWREYFHHNIAVANAAALQDLPTLLNRYDASPLFWANITLLNCGLMGLYSNFGMVVQYSKTVIKSLNSELSSVLINSPGKLRFDAIETTKNKILIITWAKSKDGEYALTQSCLLLQTILSNQSIISRVPHVAYSLYLATLVCWAQQQSSDQLVGNYEDLPPEEHRKRAFNFLTDALQRAQEISKLELRSLMLQVVDALRIESDPEDLLLKELLVLANSI